MSKSRKQPDPDSIKRVPKSVDTSASDKAHYQIKCGDLVRMSNSMVGCVCLTPTSPGGMTNLYGIILPNSRVMAADQVPIPALVHVKDITGVVEKPEGMFWSEWLSIDRTEQEQGE